MATKISLNEAPKSFSSKIVFPLVNGGNGTINVEYRYRDRIEHAEFIAELFPEIGEGDKAQPETSPGDGIDIVANAKKDVERAAKRIIGCVLSWDLDDELNDNSAKKLVTKYPAAADEIIKRYTSAINEGRAKN